MKNPQIEMKIHDLFTLAMQAYGESRVEDVVRYADQIQQINNADFTEEGAAAYHLLFGIADSFFMRRDQALTHLNKALMHAERSSDAELLVRVLANLGRFYGIIGNYETSLTFLERALEIDPRHSVCMNNAGVTALRMKNYTKALEFFVALLEEDKKPRTKMTTLSNIGSSYFFMAQYQRSLDYFLQARRLSEVIDYPEITARINYFLGKNYRELGDIQKAKIFADYALEIVRQFDLRDEYSHTYNLLASIAHDEQDFESAYQYAQMENSYYKEFNSNEMNAKLAELEARFSIERKMEKENQNQLIQSKTVAENQMKHFKKAYQTIIGIGKIGVFSAIFKDIMNSAELFHRDRSVPVLIEGETGTGKEIIARMIHFGKNSVDAPFVIVNCAAIPETLFESELFGYDEGAFTGARKQGRIGKLEMAQGGTIFLDEIGELPLSLQPKLLRVLQQKELIRVGGEKSIKLDVRFICATNRSMQQEMEAGRFRADLFYRLNTGRIFIPPLRERKEEIVPLAHMFLSQLAKEKNKEFVYIDDDAISILEHYNWPGNVRELQNTIERVILLNNDVSLRPNHLEFLPSFKEGCITRTNLILTFDGKDQYPMNNIKEQVFEHVIRLKGGNITSAAKFLNVSTKTLYRRSRK